MKAAEMKAKPRKPGFVVEEFDVTGKDGKAHHVVFRYPRMPDIDQALKFVNALMDEAEYIRLNKNITRKQEEKWLKEKLEKIAKREDVMIFVFVDGKLAGNVNAESHGGNSAHVGEIGISLREKYTGLGIGSRLLKAIEPESRRVGFEVLRISCYKGNKRARHVYGNLKFKEIGIIPKARKRNGKYDDEVIMHKDIGTK